MDEKDQNKEFLILGKKSKNVFNLHIKNPLSVLQGVAFAISSFEKKLACEWSKIIYYSSSSIH